MNLGRSLLGRGRAREAGDLLATGTERAPSDPELLALYGEALLRLGQNDKAKAAFETSLRLKPDQTELRQRLKGLGPEVSSTPVRP